LSIQALLKPGVVAAAVTAIDRGVAAGMFSCVFQGLLVYFIGLWDAGAIIAAIAHSALNRLQGIANVG
jgi:hypothetical protein